MSLINIKTVIYLNFSAILNTKITLLKLKLIGLCRAYNSDTIFTSILKLLLENNN